MDFTLDKKHEMARGLFKDFAEAEVKPLAMEIDEEQTIVSVFANKREADAKNENATIDNKIRFIKSSPKKIHCTKTH